MLAICNKILLTYLLTYLLTAERVMCLSVSQGEHWQPIRDPFKLTSPVQHAFRRVISLWNFLAQTRGLAYSHGGACARGLCSRRQVRRARMRQRDNRRVYARKFQNEITRAMHAGQERSV